MIFREDFWKIIKRIEAKGSIHCWPIYVIAEHTAAALYMLAPLHKPRKMEYIMDKYVSRLRKHEEVKSHGADGTEKFYYFETDFDGIRKIIKDTLFGIREFRELNLTQNEYEAEIDPDDPNRNNYVFTSAYDVYPEDHWREDFIDLDAAIQNIMCGLRDAIAVDACFDAPENLKTKLNHFVWDIKRKFRRFEAPREEVAATTDSTSTKSFKEVMEETMQKDAMPVGHTTLSDFIKAYVCRNSIIRLWRYIPNEDGVGSVPLMITEHNSRDVNDGDKEVGMEWAILDGSGWQAKYSECLVIGISDIVCPSYPEAINIIINPIGIDFDEEVSV